MGRTVCARLVTCCASARSACGRFSIALWRNFGRRLSASAGSRACSWDRAESKPRNRRNRRKKKTEGKRREKEERLGNPGLSSFRFPFSASVLFSFFVWFVVSIEKRGLSGETGAKAQSHARPW